MKGLLDLAGKPVESYAGEPSEFEIGDRVQVKEDSGPLPGWTGEVVGYEVHRCPPRPENDFLMPVVKLDNRSRDGETETYYPFSLRLLDPIEAIARLA
jgi:hypothetical protein